MVFARPNDADKLLAPLLTRFTVIHLKPYTKEEFVEIAALLHDSLGFQSIYADDYDYAIRLNMLYRVAFRKISFTMLGNFLAVTCSPNILLIDEKAVSAIHLCP